MSNKISLIIKLAYKVFNGLGAGFLERVYQNALSEELKDAGFDVKKEWPVYVDYNGKCVGNYFADLLLDDEIIIETKTVRSLNLHHIRQVKNYLKATSKETGLLINFGERKVEIKRIYP